MSQKRKSPKKKPAAKRPQRKKPAKQKIQPVEEILFRVEAKMSTFGGPRDTGMSADEGLALFTQADLQDPKYSYLLGLQTDDVVRITISALRAIPVKPAKGAQQPASAIRTAAPTKPVGQALRPGALSSLDRFLGRG
jgi:hypothetical protein